MKIHLQLANLRTDNVHIAQLSDACRDRVGNLVIRDQRIHHRASAIDGLARVRTQQHRSANIDVRDFAHGFERKIVSVDM